MPALILIHNGQLLLDLRAGETKERFKSALLKTLSSPFPIATQSAAPGSPDPATNRASTDQGPSTAHDSSDLPAAANAAVNRGSDTRRSTSPQSITQGADALLFTAQPPSNEATLPLPPSSAMDPAHDHTPHSTSHSSSSANQHSQAVQNLLADRRRRLEIDKQEKDAAEKTDRKAKAKARRDAITNAPDSTKAKQATYAAQQRKRQQETKRERERILRQIEHDKAERREKEERRKALRVETESADGASGLVDQQLSNEVSAPRSMRSRDCAVQIRLFGKSWVTLLARAIMIKKCFYCHFT